MADVLDITAVDPVLELTLGPALLRCSGTLSGRTRRYVLEAVETLLSSRPAAVTVDVRGVCVADVDGANIFVHIQHMARAAGARLIWLGLES